MGHWAPKAEDRVLIGMGKQEVEGRQTLTIAPVFASMRHSLELIASLFFAS